MTVLILLIFGIYLHCWWSSRYHNDSHLLATHGYLMLFYVISMGLYMGLFIAGILGHGCSQKSSPGPYWVTPNAPRNLSDFEGWLTDKHI